MTTITGIPSHGKSEWLDSLMINVAQEHGWKFLICSPESHPIEQHVARLSAKYIGKPFESGSIKKRMTEAEAEVSMAWLEIISKDKIYRR